MSRRKVPEISRVIRKITDADRNGSFFLPGGSLSVCGLWQTAPIAEQNSQLACGGVGCLRFFAQDAVSLDCDRKARYHENAP